jgi:hypothetical protein
MKGRGKKKHHIISFHNISTTRLQVQMHNKMEFWPVEYKIIAELCGTSTLAKDFSPRSKVYCQLIYHSGLIWRNQSLNFVSPCIIIQFKWINQLDATISPVYYLTFIYSSTCFGRPHAHHQELSNCSSSLWCYHWSVRTPETCSAVHKRQVINLRNCGI